MRKLVVLVTGLALALPAPATAARFALGVDRGFSAERIADRVEAATGRPEALAAPSLFTLYGIAPRLDGWLARGISQ